MIKDLILMNGYGVFVWSSFIITFWLAEFLLQNSQNSQKYEKEFAKEIEELSTEKKKIVLENSKIASKILSSYNKSI